MQCRVKAALNQVINDLGGRNTIKKRADVALTDATLRVIV